jgi:hypothetical protein
MPSWIVHPTTGELVPRDDYYLEKYMETEHLHMTQGNRKVQIYYNSDQMELTRHMASGKYFTSKKKFRDETRAYGCIEVGNETKHLTKPRKKIELNKKQRREDIKKSIYQLRNGMKPK